MGGFMTQTLEAIFDGETLRPEQPLDLPRNMRVRITIETPEPVAAAPRSFLQTARALKLEGPSDWSEKVDDYLYGNSDNATE
jgi:hypothetical protein